MADIHNRSDRDDLPLNEKPGNPPPWLLRREAFRRGVFLLPNLVTTASLFCGFASMIRTMHGDYVMAAWLILASAIFDAFDGTVARITNTASDFGVEYDSLADAIAFGVAPALLMYRWALEPFGRWGWSAAFVFAACTVLRLARFNVQTVPGGSKFFAGLPAPGGGGMVASTVFFYHFMGWMQPEEFSKQVVLLLESFALGMLMVSTIPYISSKKLGLDGPVPFIALIPIPFVIVLFIQEPEIALFSVFSLYVALGPLLFILRRGRRKEMIDQSE